ncbi:MAG: InlB B-repeat-containing protein [Clostridiales bacterium]|nr:InlB B-repeat-containing protein [Clostridiales bacterium]
MSIIDSLKAWPKAKKITVAVIAGVVVAAVGVTAFLIHRNNILATTMRLLKVEGTVNIEDSSGNVKPVIDNIRFQSGDTLRTGADGLASIGLDDTKIVTLQNDSSAQFLKNGKQIELKLKQGGVFFEVTEKLTDDETYEIETSNMTVGIRGTSGYVWYDESGLQSLIITDGKVVVSGYNPKTGETKTVEVCGGQRVSCYLYSDITEERTSIEFELTDVSEEELPEFALQMLAENDALLEKVCAETGWDKDKLLEVINEAEDTLVAAATAAITDTPTPTATNTPIPTISPTTSPSPTITSTPGATNTPTATPTTTEAPVPTVTTEVTPTATPTTAVVTYKVTFDVNGHGDGIVAQTVDSGDKASAPSSPSEEGYTFAGWYTDPDCTEKYDFDSPVKSDITLYAKWTAVTYTVSFDTDGVGSAPSSQTVKHGGTVTKPSNPSAEGYTFNGWYTNNDCTERYDFDTKVTSDITIYAGWTHIAYTVSFDTDDLGTEPEPQTVYHGDMVSPPVSPSEYGYTFTGWYADIDLTEPYDFDLPVTSDITLYAGWDLNSYTVTFNANGQGTAPDAQDIYYGYSATEPEAPSATGYTFGGWYTDSGCVNLYDFSSAVTTDITLFAKWTLNTYNVTFNANGHGSAPAAQTISHGSKVNKPADPSVTGYTFGGWYTDSACKNSYNFDSAVTSDVTLYAKWTINTYTVTFNANGHGSAPAAQTIDYGSKATKPTNPSVTGYTFGGWYTNSACTTSYDFNSAVTSDITLYAKWTINTYTVTFNSNGQGATPASQTINYGGKVNKPSDLTSNVYIFGGWYKDSNCNNSYDFNSAVTSDITLYAKWTGPDDTIPSGWVKDTTGYNALPWGTLYNGKPVYICYALDNSHDPSVDYYKGWYNYQWVNLYCDLDVSSNGTSTYTYKLGGKNGTVYYEEVLGW